MPDRISPEPVQLFYSYSHEDEVLCSELDKHLSLLHREGLLAPWHDRDIQTGSEWRQEIDAHLNTASLILLLISPDFLSSDYCYEYEMQQALERHRQGSARVVPVILRPCDWRRAPIGSLRALPRDGKAITTWANRDEAFLEVERSLRALLEQPQKARRSSLSTSVSTRNREAMLLQLQRMYQGLLAESLQETAWIEAGLVEQPGAVQNATNLILHRATQPPRPLPLGTSVLQVYQQANRELLILGPPGVGKSTLLYQLGRDLLDQTTQQVAAPLPVLFPLSSWAEKRQPLGEWMVEQLASPLYLVPRKQSRQWVQDEQILPLLDGLDEMEETACPACIAAINAYRGENPLCPLVVCSRSDEYRAATSAGTGDGRLQLQNAIEIQLLSLQQLDTALSQAGEPVAALRSALQTNEELGELARTPLWLNVLLLTFKNTPIDALPQQRAALQQLVCGRYVRRMIEEKGNRERYPPAQTTRWLSFLAEQMRKQNLTTFAVELLQPDWLARRLRIGYRWSVVLVFELLGGLFGGLLFGPSYGLLFGLDRGLNYGLVVGLLEGGLAGMVIGLAFALAFVLYGWLQKRITLAENLIWSWKKALRFLVVGPSFGLLFGRLDGGLVIGVYVVLVGGLVVGMIFGLVGGLIRKQGIERHVLPLREGLRRSLKKGLRVGALCAPVGWLIFGLIFTPSSTLVSRLVVGLVGGLVVGGLTLNHYLEHHALSPGEGLRRSLRTGLLCGLLCGPVCGSILSLFFTPSNGLFFGLFFAPFFALFGGLFGLLIFGLGAVVEHFLLRFWLWRSGVFPFRAIAFLEDARARHLLQRIGGSYRFVHRLLLDYFADLDDVG